MPVSATIKHPARSRSSSARRGKSRDLTRSVLSTQCFSQLQSRFRCGHYPLSATLTAFVIVDVSILPNRRLDMKVSPKREAMKILTDVNAEKVASTGAGRVGPSDGLYITKVDQTQAPSKLLFAF